LDPEPPELLAEGRLFVPSVPLGHPTEKIHKLDFFPELLSALELEAGPMVQAPTQQHQFYFVRKWLSHGCVLQKDVEFHRKIMKIPRELGLDQIFCEKGSQRRCEKIWLGCKNGGSLSCLRLDRPDPNPLGVVWCPGERVRVSLWIFGPSG
jgi:hypothetical protein